MHDPPGRKHARPRIGQRASRKVKTQILLKDHFEMQVDVDAPPAEVFDFLDDHRRLSAHMTKSTWMMAGSHMNINLDKRQGRAVGSKITLNGNILGLSLHVEEIVTEYDYPYCKAWKTIGSPRLIVIGSYGMGFSLYPRPGGSQLSVFIDYSPPSGYISRLLGHLFGTSYARWCTNRMARDAARHFHACQSNS